MPGNVEYYARYGLAVNPFSYKLNPLERPEDSGRYARVAAFGAILDGVDKLIDDSIAGNTPAKLLICGGSGSGRGSIASYALARYRDQRQLPTNRFLIPDVKVNNFAADVLRSWMIELGGFIDDIENPRVDIGDLAPKLGAAALGGVADKVLLDELRLLATRAARMLRDARPEPAGFGVLLKGIPTLELFTSTVDVFKRAPTIVVATAADTTRIEGELLAAQRVIQPVTHADVPDLIDKRWQDFGAAGPNPFDADGLKEAFDGAHPIERVLLLVGRVLDSRLNSFPRGQAWPADPNLGMNAEYIVRQVGIEKRDWRESL
jgi:hypothetical protein